MHPGKRLAERFTIERRAGAGGMGTVYRAHDAVRGGAVALKLLKGDGPSDHARFLREARVLAKLDHPGIVRYVDHGFTAAGEPYLAMEWLEGEDLAERLARGPLTVDESLALVGRVAEALGAAHARGVVHRDIKPSNLFLVGCALEQVKVLDFGVASLSDASRIVTSTGHLLGTPAYMAPEQARSERDLDARVDVFSLGCVLFHCLAGRPPFEGAHLAVLAKILFEEPPRVRELRGDVPRALDDLIARMLSKEIAARPRDGAGLKAAIASVLDPSGPAPSLAMAPALTGVEQRLVSVILVDLAADMSDEMVTLPLHESNALFERLRAVAARFDAQYRRLYGGAAVATLAGRGTAKDQVVHAARCALALRAAWPSASLSLATGRCMLQGRLPLGEAIDRAAALLEAAAFAPPPPSRALRAARPDPGVPASRTGRPVYIDEVTAGLLDARFDAVPGALGFDLWGEREGAAETVRTLLGMQTPCVGRDRELALLAAMFFECAADGVARAVLVTGAAGVGKTRVRHEFLRSLRGSGQPVEPWLAACDAMRAGSPFGVIAQLLRSAAGIAPRDPIEVRRDKLRARVGERLTPADSERVSAFLGEIMGSPFPDEHAGELRAARKDPLLMGEQMRRAFHDFVAAECAAQPVVIVIEDLQWGDLVSTQLIDALLRSLRERPLMVLGLARPEVHDLFPRLWVERSVQEIRLSELSRKASERLVRKVLGDRTGPEVVERIASRAAGNAFYLEELIRAEAEGKGAEAPGTVLAMVQARLAALPPEARRVIRAASVFGEVFWEDGVRALFGDVDMTTNLEPWITTLVDRELILCHTESRFDGQREYAFQHALVREGAYGMLPEADRALGHLLVGDWLEHAGEEEPATLAEHFERGGDRARAAALYARAMEQALEAHALDALLAHGERALSCGAEGPLLGAVRALSAEAHRLRGEVAEAERGYRDALALLPPGDPRAGRARAELVALASARGDAP